MRVHRVQRWVSVLLALPILLLLLACGVQGGPAAAISPTTAAQLPPTPLSTGTPSPVSSTLPPELPVPDSAETCANLPEFASAHISYLYNLDLPDDSVVMGSITSAPGTPMQIVAYAICLRINPGFGTPTYTGTPMEQVLAKTNVVSRGWRAPQVFPTDGARLSACVKDQRCFTLDPQTFALFEQVHENRSGLATFYLRMALPQPPAPCDPVLFPIYTYPDSVTPYWAAPIPLPPGTRVSIGQGTSEGIKEYFCSAGTAKQITDFMQKNVPRVGWQSVNVSGLQLWKLKTPGAPTIYMRLYPVTDPLKWAELEYNQGFTP